jgi:transglutaminase-like putative cysteine protease
VDWVERVPRAGGKLFFQTTYETTSVTRELTPEAAQKARWRNRRVTTTPEMNPEIVEMAKTLIKEPTPIDALIKFSHWLVERIRYDITVESSSVDEALLAGAGDCGPRARIMLQFCDAIGIPTKSIGGASLRFEDGGIDRINFAVKSIRSNSHAWLEVDIPGLGWLEIEPAAQDKTFKVEFHRIQTKGLAHTFRVRLEEKGKWTTTKWESYDDDEVGTRYLSDIGLSNVVTFSEID